MKQLTAITLTLALCLAVLTGCSGGASTQTGASGTASEAVQSAAGEAERSAPAAVDEDDDDEQDADEEENYNTGDAGLDDARNQDDIGEQELLVVSFGTSFNDSRRLTIGAIEQTLAERFPDWSVRRAFTSQIIIDHIQDRDGVAIDNVRQALDRAADNGVKRLLVQPTHLMDGLEYHDLVDEVGEYADAFEQVSVAEPLLSSDADFEAVVEAVTTATRSYDDGQTAICFMGHGTEAESNAVYARLQALLSERGFANYFIGTVEATPSLEDVLSLVEQGDYKRVVLQPLMVVAGDHANNDMAGDEEDSWKSVFSAKGYEVECVLQGLGENEAIRELYAQHAQAELERMKQAK